MTDFFFTIRNSLMCRTKDGLTAEIAKFKEPDNALLCSEALNRFKSDSVSFSLWLENLPK